MIEMNRRQSAAAYIALCDAMGVPPHGPTEPHHRAMEHRAYLMAFEPINLPHAEAASARIADAIEEAGGNVDGFNVRHDQVERIAGDEWLSDAMLLLGAERSRDGESWWNAPTSRAPFVKLRAA